MTKQRGIIMSAPMVLANLAKIKTETRRIIEDCQTLNHPDSLFVGFTNSKSLGPNTLAHFKRKESLTFFAGYTPKNYGKVGDILYQRENLYCGADGSWRYKADDALVMVDKCDEPQMVAWAFHKEQDYCPSIHMPKFAARCWFEIVEIGVERIQDITEDGAIAEGINIFRDAELDNYYIIPRKKGDIACPTPVLAYRKFVCELNGLDMKENPYVWVIKYKHIEKPKGGES